MTIAEEGETPPKSLVVYEVTRRGVGQRMGFVQGDVVLAVNGQKVHSIARLKEALEANSVFVIWRDKESKKHYGCEAQRLVVPCPDVKQAPIAVGDLQTGIRFEDLRKPKD